MLTRNVTPVTVKLTKSEHTVELLPYFPYGAEQAVQAVILRSTKIDMQKSVENDQKKKAAIAQGKDTSGMDGDVMKTDNIDATVYHEMVKEKLKHLVISIDGNKYDDKTEMVEDLYGLPKEDVDQVIAAITEIESDGKMSDPKDSESQES